MYHPLILQIAVNPRVAGWLPLLLPLIPGALAVYLLLPRPQPIRRLWGAVSGALAIVLAGVFLIHGGIALPETVLFCAFAGIAILAAGMMITFSNPAYAALSFALVVLSSCGLFLLQGAPFLAAATIIIYAGAIIVTFLFVLMLAQPESWSNADARSREPFLATVAGFVLLGALLYLIRANFDSQPIDRLVARADLAAQQTSLEDMKKVLGEETVFIAEFRQQVRTLPPSPARTELDAHLDYLLFELPMEIRTAQEGLENLVTLAQQARAGYGAMPPPPDVPRSPFSVPDPRSGENVAPLGRTLFTDYLLAVEAAGVLLTVASIGAIVITARRGEVRA